MVGQRSEVAAAGAGRVHPEHAGGDGIVGATMGNGGFHGDDGELRGLDALVAPLAEIKGRRLDAGKQDGDACVTNDGARPHVETIAAHAGEVALFVFEFEAAIAERDDFDFEIDGACIESAAFATDAERDFGA